jgi:flagellar hook-basal body complex protein FliE
MSDMIAGISLGSSIGSTGPIGSLSNAPAAASGEPEAGFGGLLTGALSQVDQLNTSAQQQIGSLLENGNSDLSSVMVAVEKADVAFQLMMQVRNKIVSAYQSVEQMQF